MRLCEKDNEAGMAQRARLAIVRFGATKRMAAGSHRELVVARKNRKICGNSLSTNIMMEMIYESVGP